VPSEISNRSEDESSEKPPETEKERRARLKREEKERKNKEKMMKKLTQQIMREEEKKVTRFYRKKTKNAKMSKPEQDQSDIYDIAVEMYLKDKFSLFKYQSFNPLFMKNLAEDEGEGEGEGDNEFDFEPDERSKLNKDNFEIPDSDGQTFSRVDGYKGRMYIPPVFRHSYQLSIWKVDDFGVVKIVNKYFTPKNTRATLTNFPGFLLELSLDEQTMLMVEKDSSSMEEKI
jgi:hypothetical protein